MVSKEMAGIKDKTTRSGNWELTDLTGNFNGLSSRYLKSVTQMSSVSSEDVSGHVEKISSGGWHLEHLSVPVEEYVDLEMVVHRKASAGRSCCWRGVLSGVHRGESLAVRLLFLTAVSLTRQVWVSWIRS